MARINITATVPIDFPPVGQAIIAIDLTPCDYALRNLLPSKTGPFNSKIN
jgi:hypothetical protein